MGMEKDGEDERRRGKERLKERKGRGKERKITS